MRLIPLALLGALVFPPAALAQSPETLRAQYATYAAGFQVAAVSADLSLGAFQYQVRVAYHTTGLVGFFDRGRQSNLADGIWHAGLPQPHEFSSAGTWRGVKHITVIDYHDGNPLVRQLRPPDANRQPVPPALREHALDRLSALALLMRRVAVTQQCDTTVRTYDGRRLAVLTAHTVRWERLPRTSRSAYSGPALRCDFTSHLLAGFKTDASKDQPPLHGSIWFGAAVPHEPPIPVRLSLETGWFGAATVYLTRAEVEPAPVVAQRH